MRAAGLPTLVDRECRNRPRDGQATSGGLEGDQQATSGRRPNAPTKAGEQVGMMSLHARAAGSASGHVGRGAGALGSRSRAGIGRGLDAW